MIYPLLTWSAIYIARQPLISAHTLKHIVSSGRNVLEGSFFISCDGKHVYQYGMWKVLEWSASPWWWIVSFVCGVFCYAKEDIPITVTRLSYCVKQVPTSANHETNPTCFILFVWFFSKNCFVFKVELLNGTIYKQLKWKDTQLKDRNVTCSQC